MAPLTTQNGPFILITQTGREKYPGFENHRCSKIATTMGEFHNILFRALNSAYIHSSTLSTKSDVADLLQYSQIVCELIHEHHNWEETNYFAALENAAGLPGLFSINVEQHHEFEEGLDRFTTYCHDPMSEQGFGNGAKFREMMDDFAPSLQKHMHAEPETFYGLREASSELLDKVFAEQEKLVVKKANPWKLMPLVLGSSDRNGSIDGLKEPLHVMPWFMPYLAQYVFSWRYARLWRFTYADYWGNPR